MSNREDQGLRVCYRLKLLYIEMKQTDLNQIISKKLRKGEFLILVGHDYYPITGWTRLVDFFWRIVITYLGYQLIQAFRKYSKKTS
jgi:hypothetical protein